jgi:hypothetical protein
MNIIEVYLYGCHSHEVVQIDLDSVKRIWFYHGLEECMTIELKDGRKLFFEAGWDHVQGGLTCVYDSDVHGVCLSDELRYIMDPKRRGEDLLLCFEDLYYFCYDDKMNPYLDYVVPHKRNRVKDNRQGRKALHKRYV